MKRSHEDAPAGMLSLRLCLTNRQCAAIIGKAGARIKEIRLSSGATVTIAESVPNAADRRVTTTGSATSLCKAAQQILEVLEEADKEEATTLKMILSNEQAGGVIGQAGATINSIRQA